nr:DUF1360 domain-containing protein [Tomitella cavernea]
MTCPFCLDKWVVTGFVIDLVDAPRGTMRGPGAYWPGSL